MLRELAVRNFAVIDQVRVPFGPGLNILSGETGAGKSILVDALTLLLGGRAQTDLIRTGADSATVSAAFDLGPESPGALTLTALGYPLGSEEGLILRREISRSGRGRAHLNDAPATVALLEDLGEALVEIHGQHEAQSLLRPSRHLDLLDGYAGLKVPRDQVRSGYEEWLTLARGLDELRRRERERLEREDLLRFQMQEIEAAALKPGEEEELQQERRRLQFAEKLLHGTSRALGALYTDAGAASSQGAEALRALRDLTRVDQALGPVVETLEAALVQLDDVALQIRAYRDRVEADPGRLEVLEQRLEELSRLKKKYGGSAADVLAYRQAIEKEAEELGRIEERTRELEEKIEGIRHDLEGRALELSRGREQAARKLEDLVAKELKDLGMAKTRFAVHLLREGGDGPGPRIGKDGWRLGPRGIDRGEFFISPNPGEEPRPLARIASGGEFSRIMLALKTVVALTDAVPVLIFDEVDAGVGGRTGGVIGKKLKHIARARQVICITHLPQIACYADQHLRVEKSVRGGTTQVRVGALEGEARVQEIARMLGGEKLTEISVTHARELLRQAKADS